MNKLSDNWQTPQDLFDVLDKGGEYMGMKFEGFNFGIDLCAIQTNSKCKEWCIDYLKDRARLGDLSEAFERNLIKAAFMNPPYSNPKPFIEKAWEDSKHCKIVCLVKCDPSTQWWATFWDYDVERYRCAVCQKQGDVVCRCSFEEFRLESYMYNGPKLGCSVRFFPKRIKFDPPQELIDSGEVWKEEVFKDCLSCYGGNEQLIYGGKICNTCVNTGVRVVSEKWVQKCSCCYEQWQEGLSPTDCLNCKNKGYKELSGPTFSCALLIFDRRGVE